MRRPSASERSATSSSLGLRLGSLASFQGACLLDVAVQAPDALPDALERLRDLGAVEQRRRPPRRGRRSPRRAPGRARRRARAVAVAAQHVQRAAGEVAVVVGELGLVALLEAASVETLPSWPKRDLAEAVVAQRVGAELVDDRERVEHVAQRLGHLLAVHQQVAVDEDVLRQLDSPAASSIAGQKTQWNLRMSLPMTWNVAGQNAVGQVLAVAARSASAVK